MILGILYSCTSRQSFIIRTRTFRQ